MFVHVYLLLPRVHFCNRAICCPFATSTIRSFLSLPEEVEEMLSAKLRNKETGFFSLQSFPVVAYHRYNELDYFTDTDTS